MVLSHLGFGKSENPKYTRDIDLAEKVKDIDVIIGGHSHTKMEEAVVVNGVRSPAEIKEFKRNFKFKLIALKAPIELRFKRILRRGRRDDPKRFQDFMWSERMERKWGLAKTVESADYSVKNEGKKSEAVAKLKSIMRRLAH